jgi:hypothetical protein
LNEVKGGIIKELINIETTSVAQKPRDEPFQAWFDSLTTLSKIEGRAISLCFVGLHAIRSTVGYSNSQA